MDECQGRENASFLLPFFRWSRNDHIVRRQGSLPVSVCNPTLSIQWLPKECSISMYLIRLSEMQQRQTWVSGWFRDQISKGRRTYFKEERKEGGHGKRRSQGVAIIRHCGRGRLVRGEGERGMEEKVLRHQLPCLSADWDLLNQRTGTRARLLLSHVSNNGLPDKYAKDVVGRVIFPLLKQINATCTKQIRRCKENFVEIDKFTRYIYFKEKNILKTI